jgi:hypothetical protein
MALSGGRVQNSIEIETQGDSMPRIIVTTDPFQLPDDTAVMLDEQVHSVHLSTSHAAAQLIQRLAWAVSDAEGTEGARPVERTASLQSLTLPRAERVQFAVQGTAAAESR